MGSTKASQSNRPAILRLNYLILASTLFPSGAQLDNNWRMLYLKTLRCDDAQY
jgi:hypothetical protein